MKRLILTTFIALTTFASFAQNNNKQTKQIPINHGEKWWGGMTAIGNVAPFDENMKLVKISSQSRNNQTFPILLSDRGRYIYSEKPFDFEMKDGLLILHGDNVKAVKVNKVGKTLRHAFMVAATRHFPMSEKLPPLDFFKKPQYNTWIELGYNQSQAGVEKYVEGIIDNGFPTGIMMIDDGWAQYHGAFEFNHKRFPNPKEMCEDLKYQGFKIMLWISPFVSADSETYRIMQQKDLLVKDEHNQPYIVRWWNGYSAVIDLTNPVAMEYVKEKLDYLITEYDIDGFKFDGGDLDFYNKENLIAFDKDAVASTHTERWTKLASEYAYNELRASWGHQGEPVVQRLGDKDNSWYALSLLIPEITNLSLMGYPYVCPDMVGGGQISSFTNIMSENIDQKLIVRSAQVHALMPMMQFSVAPWRVLDTHYLKAVKKAIETRKELMYLIMRAVNNAATTGEPIVRNMEYSFALKGFSDCNDQFLIGEDLLVAPILTPDDGRLVRLPRGRWQDDLGQVFKGPRLIEINDAPIDRLPYYIAL